ncbi:MAG TPA: ATP-dependent DNA helicase RecG [Patescibacteria group bacterium]|nr:ATP-dependent DNA helicase RecG [Patescibacteria group bacterium]
MDLSTPLAALGPVFRMKRSALSKIGLETVEDLLLYTPFRYDNNLIVSKIGPTQPGETVTIQGNVIKTSNVFTKKKLTIQRIIIEDETGSIEAVFFNQRFLLKNVHEGDFVSFAGRIDRFGNKKTIAVRSYEVLKSENSEAIHTIGLVPIYSEKNGLTSKWFRNRIKPLIDNLHVTDYLPESIIHENQLMSLSAAISSIHFPKTLTDAERARLRFSFDELLIRNAAASIRKKKLLEKERAVPFEVKKNKPKIQKFIKSLPFELTSAQRKAIDDIFSDLSKDTPMNRLLEGDVGSGKTVVASVAAYLAYLNGFQVAFMAPTEILANQHFLTLSKFLEPQGLKIELLTGSSKKKDKGSKIKEKNQPPTPKRQFDIAVGTHALIHKRAEFEKMGLVIIDEQQRFGVEQRAILKEKGTNPHLLSMTATPIPRTIFLTIYADLALSVLDELPVGRKRVKTWLTPEEKRENGYKWIAEKVKGEKSQVFIVCPFIEPSETLSTVKAAKEEFEKLQKEVFPDLNLGLLHGKMKAAEKDEVIKNFREGKVDILVATPVIEVGIDIPTADIIVIEAADRFGLAQLHQLRGRVGRGDKESYCLLFSDSKSDTTRERLTYLQTISDGAKLAEIDLKLRGPGDMFGTAQHGAPDLRIASLTDLTTVEAAAKAAEKILPQLDHYLDLKERIEQADIPKVSKD